MRHVQSLEISALVLQVPGLNQYQGSIQLELQPGLSGWVGSQIISNCVHQSMVRFVVKKSLLKVNFRAKISEKLCKTVAIASPTCFTDLLHQLLARRKP
jgi:hypothetical protein